MHTFLTYALLPSGWHPVRESLVESGPFPSVDAARNESLRRARELYPSHVTKTIILEFK